MSWAAASNLRWQDLIELGFSPGASPVVAGSMATVGNTLFVTSAFPHRASPGSNANIHVRAYDLRSGDLSWETVWAPTGFDDAAVGLIASSKLVVVAGKTGLNTTSQNFFVVQAFDTVSGAMRWNDSCGFHAPSRATDIASAGNLVFVAGVCPDDSGNIGIIRAYDLSTGALAWEVRGPEAPQNLALAGGRLFAAAIDTDGALQVQSYHPNNGDLLWQTSVVDTLGAASTHLVAGGGNVYLSWEAGANDGSLTRGIDAVDMGTGDLLWQATPADRVNGLDTGAGLLLVAQSGASSLLTAYDAGTGAVVWDDQPGTPDSVYYGRAVTIGNGQIVLVGSSYTNGTAGAENLLVRAYSHGGSLLWEDNTPTTAMIGAIATDVLAAKSMVIVSGATGRPEPPFGNLQLFVRAYDRKKR